MRAVVTATNDIDTASKATAVTNVVVAFPPANHALVTITGAAKNGNTLTEHEGNWDGTAPVTFTYQWRLCDNNGNNCNDILGETGTTYQVQASDEGSTIRVVVTGHNTAGDVPSTSDATAVVTTNPPVNTVIPDVEGTAADGNVLTTDNGTWTGLAPFTYTYTWLRCDAGGNNCNPIDGETANQYTLTTADLGHTIRSSVVAHNADGDSAPAQSHPGDPITAIAPIPMGFLTIGGTAERGQTLSANNPTWIGSAPINFTYQWRACDTNGENCVDIQDATDSTYDLGLSDIGTTLRVVVTATNAAGTSSFASFPSAVITASAPDAPTNVVATHGDQSISVAFDVPFDGGSPLIGFMADCSSSNGGVENTAVDSGSPIVVSGLTNGKDYTCTVITGNNIGLSALSDPSNQVTPAAAPDAPTVTGISRGDHSLTVTFSDNGSGGAPITDHTATCTSSDGGASGSASGDSPITIAGLTLHKHYTCTVIATSGVANSDSSDPSDSEVVPSLPDAPTGVSAQRGDSTIRLSFTELNSDDTQPSNNDSSLDGYRATCT